MDDAAWTGEVKLVIIEVKNKTKFTKKKPLKINIKTGFIFEYGPTYATARSFTSLEACVQMILSQIIAKQPSILNTQTKKNTNKIFQINKTKIFQINKTIQV